MLREVNNAKHKSNDLFYFIRIAGIRDMCKESVSSKIQNIISHNIISHNVLYFILNYSFQLQLTQEEESLNKI